MKCCDFESLVRLLDKQLDLDRKIEVLCHLDTCATCREAIYQISRERDGGLFVPPPSQAHRVQGR